MRGHSRNLCIITADRHDFRAPARYFCTMVTAPRRALFSFIAGAPEVRLSAIGEMVAAQLEELARRHPLRVRKVALMPDHLHFTFSVYGRLARPVTQLLGAFQVFCTRSAEAVCPGVGAVFSPKMHLFVPFDDAVMAACEAYTEGNPLRWWLWRHQPEILCVRTGVRHRVLPEGDYEALGNLGLLDYPFKMAVHVPGKATEAEFDALAEKTRRAAEAGWLIAGGFISKREKAIGQALHAGVPGLRLVRLVPHGLTGFKPPAKALPALRDGRLLYLSAFPGRPVEGVPERAVFVRGNAVAEALERG